MFNVHKCKKKNIFFKSAHFHILIFDFDFWESLTTCDGIYYNFRQFKNYTDLKLLHEESEHWQTISKVAKWRITFSE